MLRNKKIAALAVVLAGMVFAPFAAQAATVVTNTGSAQFDNEWSQAMAAVTSSTPFLVALNPVLSVVKTHNVATGKAKQGDTVTYTIKVTYPRIGVGACGDDSNAVNTVITDVVPVSLTFVPGTIQVSTDNGGTFAPGGSEVGGTITVNLGTIPEGTGDAACLGVATTQVITFQATVN